jgi:hypothetical protein
MPDEHLGRRDRSVGERPQATFAAAEWRGDPLGVVWWIDQWRATPRLLRGCVGSTGHWCDRSTLRRLEAGRRCSDRAPEQKSRTVADREATHLVIRYSSSEGRIARSAGSPQGGRRLETVPEVRAAVRACPHIRAKQGRPVALADLQDQAFDDRRDTRNGAPDVERDAAFAREWRAGAVQSRRCRTAAVTRGSVDAMGCS